MMSLPEIVRGGSTVFGDKNESAPRFSYNGRLPRLGRVAAEVEGVAAFGGEIDFGDEAGLS